MRSVYLDLDAGGRAASLDAGDVLIVGPVSAGAIDITWLDQGGLTRGTIRGAVEGRKYRPGFPFTGFLLEGTPGADVTLLIGPHDADADAAIASSTVAIAGSVEVTNDLGNPLPMRATRDQTITNVAPVAVTEVAAVALAASATRRGFIARNAGASSIALIAAGGTFANSALVLLPGEIYREVDAPGAAWSAICAAGESSTLNILAISA